MIELTPEQEYLTRAWLIEHGWEPSKKTKRAFYDVGCTLDWVQRSRNRQKGVKDDDDDDDFDDDRYPLDLNDESF